VTYCKVCTIAAENSDFMGRSGTTPDKRKKNYHYDKQTNLIKYLLLQPVFKEGCFCFTPGYPQFSAFISSSTNNISIVMQLYIPPVFWYF